MKYDLSFGNSVAVRRAFLGSYLGGVTYIGKDELLSFDYPEHGGDKKAVELTRKVIEHQVGRQYKHVFLTNGATGGCTIAMRAYAQMGYKYCNTRHSPWYGRYPGMVDASGLIFSGDMKPRANAVNLLDLPSNPLARMDNPLEDVAEHGPLILDGVYLNKVYMPPEKIKLYRHNVLVGSYSKLLGINGIRLGWIATDNDVLADMIKELITSEYCGLSTASTTILKDVLFGLNWSQFETKARFYLDMNREEFAKLERFCQGIPVPDLGMFYYAPLDKKAQEIFTKAGIIWTKGSMMGTDDGFARFNLGQDIEVIENAVEAVLKADRIK